MQAQLKIKTPPLCVHIAEKNEKIVFYEIDVHIYSPGQFIKTNKFIIIKQRTIFHINWQVFLSKKFITTMCKKCYYALF